jgi:hypothetical protein
MFSYFLNKKNDIDSTKEENIYKDDKDDKSHDESDNESDNESEEDISYIHNDFLKNLIYKNDKVELYSINCREFIPSVILLSSQRDVNDKHVNNLVESITYKQHFIGTFKMVIDDNNNMRLIDGQHRYLALKKIMEKDSKFNIDIIIELYRTDSIDSENTLNLFREANNCLNVSVKDLPNTIANNVVTRLMQEFKNMIIDVRDGSRCNRPKIDKRILYSNIKKYIEEKNISEDEMYKHVLQVNIKLGLKKRTEFKPKVSNVMYEKAIKTGFFIGLEEFKL